MYDAIWLELDRDPQRPAVARVDIKTKAGDISVWCDRTGNTAVVSHKNNNNDSVRPATEGHPSAAGKGGIILGSTWVRIPSLPLELIKRLC